MQETSPPAPAVRSAPQYRFQTDEFALSDSSLHWLRSRYNYKTLPYEAFDKFVFTRGREVNNWWMLFGFGVLMLGVAGLITVIIIDDLISNPYRVTINIDMIVALVIPLALGFFSLYNSLRNGDMLYAYQQRKRHRFPLRKIVREGHKDALVKYLKEHPHTRTKLRVG